jgi:hypothetical protein
MDRGPKDIENKTAACPAVAETRVKPVTSHLFDGAKPASER